MLLLESNYAQILYNQLLEAHISNEGNYKNAIRDMRLTFESIFTTLTSKEVQAFSNLFARTVFVIDKHQIPDPIVKGISGFRKYANKAIHEEGFIIEESKYFTSIKAIASIIHFLSGELIPEDLSELYAGKGNLTFSFVRSKEIELIEYTKCTVLSIGELKTTDTGTPFFHLFCESEDDLDKFTIILWDSEYNKLTKLHTFLWVYATLAITNFKKIENHENFYSSIPLTQIIIEPDFLWI